MGNKNEPEEKEADGNTNKQPSIVPVAEEKAFFDGLLDKLELYGTSPDASETDSSEVEENLSFPTFLSLAKDLTSKWPEGTLQAYLLYKYKTAMVFTYSSLLFFHFFLYSIIPILS